MIDDVCKKIVQLGGYQLVWFGFAPDPLHDKQLIFPMHKYGSAVHYLDNYKIDLNNEIQKNGPTSTALRTGKTQAVNDFSESLFFSPWLQNALSHNIHASISLPMSLNDGQKCVLCIYSDKKNAFDLPEIGILERLANKVVYALNAIKLRYERKVAQIKQDTLIKDLSLRNRSLEDFTYLVSHNFRAKVADLLGVSALISEHTLSEADTKELNGEVGRISQKLDEVLRDLHNTLLVKGHALVNTDYIDLSKMFSDIKQNMNALIPDTHINLITDFSQANYLKTDRYYLFEACLQLMLNFVKHTEGKTYTQIKVYSNKKNDKIQLILEDEQQGFRLNDNDDSISTIYRRLYQHLTGGGIKLLYVKAIIENMGGVFSVNCEEHNNIKFIIEYAA
jgi:signal transduction histidine kinase